MPRRFPVILAPLLAAAFLLPVSAPALQVKPRAVPNGGVFGVELAGTDSQFYARADHVVSVSWQEYTTGTWIVSEVVVDMANSNQQIRLYSLRAPGASEALDAANRAAATSAELRGATGPAPRVLPATAKNLEDKVGDAVASGSAAMPVKSYPATTHAHTVEYAVGSRAELLRFYRSFRDLLIGKEVKAAAGDSVQGGASAFGTPVSTAGQATGAAGEVTVNRLGGTIFVINP